MTENQDKELRYENSRYVVSPDNKPQTKDEVDLRELWGIIWQGRWIIISITALFAVCSVFYALSLPNVYNSEALLAPASDEQQGGLGGLAGQFGGLASLAGVNLSGGKADKTTMALEILKSREFFSKFAQRHDILADLMASEGWDIYNNEVIYDEDIYLQNENEWVRKVKAPMQARPSLQEAKKTFDRILKIQQNNDTGMVNISIEHYSPYVAKQWIDWLVRDINLDMKNRDKQEAEKSITFLQSQIEKTKILEHKTLLYQLIEEQTKTLMFAEVRDEYIFKIIDPPVIAEVRAKPNRALIVILCLMLGSLSSMILILVRYYKNKSSTQKLDDEIDRIDKI